MTKKHARQIGRKFYLKRTIHKQTRSKVAKALRISARRLDRLETGQYVPTIEELCRACRLWKVSASELLKLPDYKAEAEEAEREAKYKQISEQYCF